MMIDAQKMKMNVSECVNFLICNIAFSRLNLYTVKPRGSASSLN